MNTHTAIRLTLSGDTEPIRAGLELLAPDLAITLSEDGYPLMLRQTDKPCVDIRADAHGAEITYGEKCHFFRAIGLLIEHMRNGEREIRICETPRFTMNGAMFDVSQSCNCPKDPRFLLRKMALMGLNMLMLGCEDSYEVENEPYFGYMRSRYTEAELRAFDDYAFALGIEMIPCIQTLAHLTDPLRHAVYSGIKEDSACLLVDEPKTYQFIRHLLISASRPFRTKRIHIGMDEAMHLGRGKYFTKHGYVPPHIIMQHHLDQVMDIIRELGLTPMMWGDMFFRAVGGGGYESYGDHVKLPQEVIDRCPKDMAMVYWEYGIKSEEYHRNMIRTHSALGSHTVFAGGSWAWLGFAYRYRYTKDASDAALTACKKYGVREVFCTVWGDDRNEAPHLINLPTLQLYAEHGYRDSVDDAYLAERLRFCTGALLSDFMLLDELDFTPGVSDIHDVSRNVSAGVLWQDILTGLLDRNFEGLPLEAHYTALAQKLAPAKSRGTELDDMFSLYCDLLEVLRRKAEVGIRLTAAYRAGDRAALREFAEHRLPELRTAMETLRTSHRRYFFANSKPFGWDVFDFRYGAIITRTETAIYTLTEYLAGRLERIEELELPRLPRDATDGIPHYMWHTRIMTPTSRIMD